MDQRYDLSVKTIKLLDETISVNIHDLRLSNGFSDVALKAQEWKKFD